MSEETKENVESKKENTKQDKPAKPNLEAQFKEAFSYFGPTLISQIFGGTDAAEATQAQLDRMRQAKLDKAKLMQEGLAAQEKSKLAREKAGREERSVAVREQGQKTREEELDVAKSRELLRKDETAMKRYENALARFEGREDIKKYRDFSNTVDSIKDMVTSGKSIPGASLALSARGLSSEVGVLTDKDVERAQVNPDILSKVKRGFYTYFKGEISPDDAKEMLKIANAIKAKKEGRFRKIAEEEAKLRGSRMSSEDKEKLKKDFLGKVYIYEDEDQEKNDNALIDKYL